MALGSIVDIGNDIRSGKIGVIPAIRIGDVAVSALTGLRGADSVSFTTKSVQAGFAVTDGIVHRPKERSFDIILADPEISIEMGISAALSGSWAGFSETWRDKKDTLYKHFDNIEIITAVSHVEPLPNMFIVQIDPVFDVNENFDCFIAKVDLRTWDERGVQSASDVDSAIKAASVNVGVL